MALEGAINCAAIPSRRPPDELPIGHARIFSCSRTATRRTSSVLIAKKRTWRTTHASPTHS